MLNSTVGFSCCKQYGAEIIELKRNYSYLGRWQLCFVEVRSQAMTQMCTLKKNNALVLVLEGFLVDSPSAGTVI